MERNDRVCLCGEGEEFFFSFSVDLGFLKERTHLLLSHWRIIPEL